MEWVRAFIAQARLRPSNRAMTIRLHHPTSRNLDPVSHQERREGILRQEVRGGSPEPSGSAIGNASKQRAAAPDQARLDELTRHHLGYLP